MLSAFKKLVLVSAVFMLAGCATATGGNTDSGEDFSRKAILKESCERQDKKLAPKGTVYVQGTNRSSRSQVGLYLQRESGGLPVSIARSLAINEEFGPNRVIGISQGQNVYLVFDYGARKIVWPHKNTPMTISTAGWDGRATLLNITVGPDGNTLFAHSSVVPQDLDCIED